MKYSRGEIVVVNPLTMPEWNAMVALFPESTVFHCANWARVLAESYGFATPCFALFEEGSFRGCLPLVRTESPLTGRRGVSVSFADHCGALVRSRSDFVRLFDAAVQYGRRDGWRSIEFRGEEYLRGELSSETYMHHQIELSPDEDAMHARLRESTARNIRKALREGVTVEVTQSQQGIMDYYRLHCLTRRRHGLPPQPRRFFRKVHEQLIACGFGFTALARYRGATVAGLVCLGFGGNALYKYGASDEAFQHLRGNNILLWETMKRCAQEGYRSLSLGRTEVENEGLVVFKNGWGGRVSQMHYYRYDLGLDRFGSAPRRQLSYVKKMMRRMPIGVLKGIGNLLYKYAG